MPRRNWIFLLPLVALPGNTDTSYDSEPIPCVEIIHGRSPVRVCIARLGQSSLAWSMDSAWNQSSTVLGNRNLLVVENRQEKVLKAVDAHTGNIRWECPMNSKYSMFESTGRRLLARLDKNQVSLVDLATGTPSSSVSGQRFSVCGKRLVTTMDDTIACYDVSNLQLAWKTKMPEAALYAHVDDHRAFVFCQNSIGCVDVASGKEMWSIPRAFTEEMPGRQVFVTVTDTEMIGLDPVTGKKMWSAREDILGVREILDDVVLAQAKNGRLVCVSASTGQKRWEISGIAGGVKVDEDNQECFFREHARIGRRVFVLQENGSVAAADLETGTLHWTRFFAAPAICLDTLGSHVYAASGTKLYKLNSATGTIQREIETGKQIKFFQFIRRDIY